MRFHLLPSFRKTPKQPQLSAPPAHDDPVKRAEADKRASDEASRTIQELKTFFDDNEQPTGRVLCSRGHEVGVVDEGRRNPNAHRTGRHRQSPVTPLEFSRRLLAAVNYFEAKAETADDIGQHKEQVINATTAVKELMNCGDKPERGPKHSFTDTEKLRKAVNILWALQGTEA